MKKSLIACALAFLSFPLAAQAHPTHEDTNGYVIDFLDVYYGDLNLAHPAGADVLLSRIKFAARQVCGGLPDIREVRERRHFKRCAHRAIAEAVDQVGSPLLADRFIQNPEVEYASR